MKRIKIFSILIIMLMIISVFSLTLPEYKDIKNHIIPDTFTDEIKYGYIANGNPYINYITVINRNNMTIESNITVGYGSAGIVTSPNGSFVYVSNFDSNNVSVINTAINKVTASINVGSGPGSIAISPNGKYLVVANSGSATISIINTINYGVRTVNVGGNPGGYNGLITSGYPTTVPDGIAFSPNSSYAYVSNSNGNITVVNVITGLVLKQILVINEGYFSINGLAISNNGTYLYVLVNRFDGSIDYGSHLSVINTNTFSILYNISTDYEPESIALGNNGNIAYITSGYNDTVDVINLNSKTLVNKFLLPKFLSPIGLSFSPDYQFLYVCDGNNNISVINIKNNSVSTYIIVGTDPMAISMADLYPVNFSEYGLPSGLKWSVTVNSTTITGNTSKIEFLESNGSYTYSLGSIPGYRPNNNHGNFTVAGNSVSISVQWIQVKYRISFEETGLPSGIKWSVKLSNITNSSETNTINFYEPNGTYSYYILTEPGYTASQNSGQIIIKGKNITINISWSVKKYTVTFTESGLNTGVQWSVTFNGTTVYSENTSITFSCPNGTYIYSVGKVNGYMTNNVSGTVVVSGKNIKIDILWNPVLYSIYFNETGLPAGTSWAVQLNGTTKYSNTSTIIFKEPNGSYNYNILAVNGYFSNITSGSIIVSGSNLMENILFKTIPKSYYEITFTENGLPNGTNWSVTFDQRTIYSTSQSITFYAKNGTYTYSISIVAGYSISSSTGNIVVSGKNIYKNITFYKTSTGQYEQYMIMFEESGLPNGTNWSVTVNGITKYSTGNSITFNVSNGSYTYIISFPDGYSSQTQKGTINVNGNSITVPVAYYRTSSFPWIFIFIIIIVIVLIIVFILMRKRRNQGNMNSGGSYGYPPSTNFPQNPPTPPLQQNPNNNVYPNQQTIPNTNPYQINNQSLQQPPQNMSVPQVNSMGENVLVNIPGALLATIDGKKLSIISYSGSIVITDRHLIFASKGKKATAITGALAGGIFTGLISKGMTKVDISDLMNQINEPGSFITDLSNVNSINAKPSGLSRFSQGKIDISFKYPITLNGINVSGQSVEFLFMPKGYPGGTNLKKEIADYINNSISQLIGK